MGDAPLGLMKLCPTNGWAHLPPTICILHGLRQAGPGGAVDHSRCYTTAFNGRGPFGPALAVTTLVWDPPPPPLHMFDLRCFQGNRPLHYAARDGKEAVVRCLLELGANKEATNNDVRGWWATLRHLPCLVATAHGVVSCLRGGWAVWGGLQESLRAACMQRARPLQAHTWVAHARTHARTQARKHTRHFSEAFSLAPPLHRRRRRRRRCHHHPMPVCGKVGTYAAAVIVHV